VRRSPNTATVSSIGKQKKKKRKKRTRRAVSTGRTRGRNTGGDEKNECRLKEEKSLIKVTTILSGEPDGRVLELAPTAHPVWSGNQSVLPIQPGESYVLPQDALKPTHPTRLRVTKRETLEKKKKKKLGR